jgi:hypothetical protein
VPSNVGRVAEMPRFSFSGARGIFEADLPTGRTGSACLFFHLKLPKLPCQRTPPQTFLEAAQRARRLDDRH